MAEHLTDMAASEHSDAAIPHGAAPVTLETLRKRPDFLAAARAGRAPAGSFLLQARRRGDDSDAIRVGFTCSKKVGNAVARNRAKRRLREIARLILPSQGRPGWDYVLIGWKDSTADRPFEALKTDLEQALRRVHSAKFQAGETSDRAPRRRGKGK